MSTQASTNTASQGPSSVWAREMACNVVLSLLFLQFAVAHVNSLLAAVRLSTILVVAKVSLDVVFYLTRRIPKEVSGSVYDWFIAVLGTFAIVFFRPADNSDMWLGYVLQFSGLALQSLAMLSLKRSIGIVPANRGIQTGGLYRFVRHPMYLSYVIAYLGYAINHPSAFNIGLYVFSVTLWVLRLLAEERFLMRDETYREFSQRTRFRLIPGVF